jgi:hypothetical protein
LRIPTAWIDNRGSQLPLSESAFSTRFRPFPVEIVEPFHTLTMDATTALAIYRAEKDKALRERRVSHVQLMAEAQEAFRKMLADAQLARKGGRPKGSTNAATAAAAPIAVTASAAVAVTGKLVLKPSKPTPPKILEKVTVAGSSAVKSRMPPKAAPAHASAKTAKVEKPTAEKRRPAAKAKSPAKVAKRAAAPASRKGSAKKAAAPRKQAAARERKAKARKR